MAIIQIKMRSFVEFQVWIYCSFRTHSKGPVLSARIEVIQRKNVTTVVYEDSQACILWVTEEGHKSKRIDVRSHTSQEAVHVGKVG